MKKNLKYILIMLLILLVLGGAAALLLLPQNSGENSSSAPASSSSSANETITNRETADVKAVSVQNAAGSFVLVPDGEEFTLQGYESYPVNRSTVRNTVDALVSLQVAKDLGEQSSLEDFGLSGLECVNVELQYQDGSSDKLVLGATPGETAGRYVLKDGRVYVGLGISDQLYGDGFEYFSNTLYSIPNRTEQTTDDEGNTENKEAEDILYRIKLSGAQFPEPIEIRYDKKAVSQYLISAPIVAESGNTAMTTVMDDLKALNQADRVVAAKLDDALLEKYGLKEPAAVAEFDLNSETHTVSVSAVQEGGTRYLLLDENDMVYQVHDSAVSSWAASDLMTLRQGYIWLANIMQVQRLTVTVEGDMAYVFDTTREKDEERSTEENPFYNLTVKNAAGQTLDYETYRDFYQDLLAIAVMNVEKTETTGRPAWEIEYQYFDGGKDTVSFYSSGEGRYVAKLNGAFNGIVRKSDADKLVERLPALTETLAQE